MEKVFNRAALPYLGRHVFGFGAVALGVIGLVWGDFATVWQPVQANVPHRVALAYMAAACLLAGGAGIQWRKTAQAGAVVVTILYFIFAMLWLPRVIGFPRMIGTWLGFCEQFALVLAGVITYLTVQPRDTRMLQICRVLFGLCVISFGLAHFLAIQETAGMVPHWIPPGQRFWAIATGAAHLMAGLAIISGIQAVLAARLLTMMLIGFGALVWAPSLIAHPGDHIVWGGNAINLVLVGAAWVVADWMSESQKGVVASKPSSGVSSNAA